MKNILIGAQRYSSGESRLNMESADGLASVRQMSYLQGEPEELTHHGIRGLP